MNDPNQACDWGRVGVFLPNVYRKKLAQRDSMRLVLASYFLGEGLEFEFVDSKASAFSISFHKNGAQQSTAIKP